MEDSEGHSSAHQGSGDGAMSTMNLYATLGLSPEDVDALAQIPENEISVETLPYLIMKLKAKRAKQEEQGEASPKTDSRQEDTDDGDLSKQDSPPEVPRRSNSHCDTDYRRAEIHSRPERTESRRGSRHTRPSMEKPSDSQQKIPFSYQVDDFHGVVPKVYPHTCSLCLCMLNSNKTWKEHLNGLRHAEGCQELSRLYPDWKKHDTRKEMSDSIPSRDAISTAPKSASERHYLKPRAGTKVVVTKFPHGSVCVEDLMTLAKPFGTVVKHLVFPCKRSESQQERSHRMGLRPRIPRTESRTTQRNCTLTNSQEASSNVVFSEFGSTSNRHHNNRPRVTTPAQDLYIRLLHLRDRLRPADRTADETEECFCL